MEKRTSIATTKRPLLSSRIPKRKSRKAKGSKIEAPRPLKSSSGNLKVKCPPELVEECNEPLTSLPVFMDVDDESAALSELQQIFGGGMAGMEEDWEQPLPDISFPVLGESPSPKEPKKSELPIRAKNPLHLNSTFETWPELLEALALNEIIESPVQAMVQDLASQLKLLSLNTPSPPAIDLSFTRNRSYSEPPQLGAAAVWTAVGTYC